MAELKKNTLKAPEGVHSCGQVAKDCRNPSESWPAKLGRSTDSNFRKGNKMEKKKNCDAGARATQNN